MDTLQKLPNTIETPNEVDCLGFEMSEKSCNRAQFWGAVGIFLEKPHLLNKRLCGVQDLWCGELSFESVSAVTRRSDKSLLEETIALIWKVMQNDRTQDFYVDNTLPNYAAPTSATHDVASSSSSHLLQISAELQTVLKAAGFVCVLQEDGKMCCHSYC